MLDVIIDSTRKPFPIRAIAHYEQDQEWRDWVNFDLEIHTEA
jgi:hypothetical protein